MIKAIIVDDERIIRFGIASMISWNKLGIEFSGEASSGEEGLELFKKTMPDIVITDIRMSGMNGLEMITRIKQIKPEVKFVILSGYPDFSYAKEAIQLGASDYLLKSDLMPEDIESILQRMIEEIQESEGISSVSKTIEIPVETMLSELCQGIRVLSNTDISTSESALFDGGYCCLCIGIKKDGDEEQPEVRKKTLVKIEERIKSVLFGYNIMTCLLGDVLIVLVFSEISKQTEMKGLVDEWIRMMKNRGETLITVGKSRFNKGIDQIKVCYDQACLAYNKRMFAGIGKLIEYQELTANESERKRAGEISVDYELSKIEKYVEYSDSAKLLNCLDLLFEQLKQQENYDMVHMVCMELIVLLNKCASEHYSEEVMFERKQSIYQKYRSMEEISEIGSWMKQEFFGILRKNGDRASGSKYVVGDVQKYIEENYASDLTLLQLSEMVHLNKNYLGNLFRKETGQSINDYIIEIRMEKAKELLLHTQLTAKMIAERVGYEDERYFYKVFKKRTGYTAMDFVKKFKTM